MRYDPPRCLTIRSILRTTSRPCGSLPGELLFEFVRASDSAPMSSELRFHGESYGWEAQFLVRGELFYSHGAFVTRAAAIVWAEAECSALTDQCYEPISVSPWMSST
jgi:hypothetical protein